MEDLEVETITRKEWKELHKDYKAIIDKQKYILKLVNGGTCLVPVKVADDKEDKKNGQSQNRKNNK